MRLAAAMLLLLVAPAPASASSAVLLPRAGGTGVDAAAAEQAIETARMILRNEGWTVHVTDAVSEELPAGLASCGPDDACAHALRAQLDLDVAVGLRLWGQGAEIDHLAVVVTGIRGVGHRAVATVTEEAPLPFALAEALRAALGLWASGAIPEGARGMDERVDRDPADPGDDGSFLNWVLGGLFVLGSAPMLGYAINTAVRHDDCVNEPSPGLCVERVRFGNGAGTFLGIGAATLAAGLVFLIAQPIRVRASAGTASAMLQLEGTF